MLAETHRTPCGGEPAKPQIRPTTSHRGRPPLSPRPAEERRRPCSPRSRTPPACERTPAQIRTTPSPPRPPMRPPPHRGIRPCSQIEPPPTLAVTQRRRPCWTWTRRTGREAPTTVGTSSATLRDRRLHPVPIAPWEGSSARPLLRHHLSALSVSSTSPYSSRSSRAGRSSFRRFPPSRGATACSTFNNSLVKFAHNSRRRSLPHRGERCARKTPTSAHPPRRITTSGCTRRTVRKDDAFIIPRDIRDPRDVDARR